LAHREGKFRQNDVMRRHFYFRPHGDLFDAWDVARLVELTQTLPVVEVDLASLSEIDSEYWIGTDGLTPTVRTLVRHMELTLNADLTYPIILSSNAEVMDGMHRVARALLEEHATIRAVQFRVDPEPDYLSVRLDELASEVE
jgi:hypothetical protein